MKLTDLLGVSLVLLGIYVLWSRRKFYKAFLQLPGPLGFPLLGLALKMMKPENFLQHMEKLTKEYGTPFITWLGPDCLLYVNDPETMENVFNSPCCTNKGDMYRFMASAIGDGLFTSSSPRWNKHRGLLNPAFGRKTIQAFLPVFNREANTLVNNLAMTQGQSLEIYGLLKKIVLEVSCQTTMGKNMNFQRDRSAEIFESYSGITETCVRRMLSPWFHPDATYRLTSLFRKQQKFIGVLNKLLENLMKDEEHTTICTGKCVIVGDKSHGNGDDEGGDLDNEDSIRKSKSPIFLDQVRSYIRTGQLTWQDVRDEANVIVAATFETTSTAIYFSCLCLAMHPECQDKLYNELVEIFPGPSVALRTDSGTNRYHIVLEDITAEHLKRMTYTEMVINEAMRLFAPVPIVLRRASADFHLRCGTGKEILVPAGTQIAIDIFNMHRSEHVWGPHALSFDPERHFGPSSQRHPFAFVPFTKGLRMCIGYRYALMLMKIMLAKIFLNFRVHTHSQMKDLSIKGTISLKLCEYPLFTLQPREINSPAPVATR